MDHLFEPEPAEGEFEVADSTKSPAINTSPISRPKHGTQRVERPIGNDNEGSIAQRLKLFPDSHPPHFAKGHDGLDRRMVDSRNRITEGPEQAEKRFKKMCRAVRTLIECVGDDPDREGLLATPSRYAEALLSFTQGYHFNINDIVNNALFHEGHNEMVIVKDIEIYSLCEHHLVPFIGKMQIGYMPSDVVIGLSKLPRIAEMFARRLQVQERLTREVAQAVADAIKPKGVFVTVESSHLCMVMRGVQKTSATSVTSCALGCFESKAELRAQFLGLLGVNRSWS